jgi:hypothetical protein
MSHESTLLLEVFALTFPATSSEQQDAVAPRKPKAAIYLQPERPLAQLHSKYE